MGQLVSPECQAFFPRVNAALLDLCVQERLFDSAFSAWTKYLAVALSEDAGFQEKFVPYFLALVSRVKKKPVKQAVGLIFQWKNLKEDPRFRVPDFFDLLLIHPDVDVVGTHEDWRALMHAEALRRLKSCDCPGRLVPLLRQLPILGRPEFANLLRLFKTGDLSSAENSTFYFVDDLRSLLIPLGELVVPQIYQEMVPAFDRALFDQQLQKLSTHSMKDLGRLAREILKVYPMALLESWDESREALLFLLTCAQQPDVDLLNMVGSTLTVDGSTKLKFLELTALEALCPPGYSMDLRFFAEIAVRFAARDFPLSSAAYALFLKLAQDQPVAHLFTQHSESVLDFVSLQLLRGNRIGDMVSLFTLVLHYDVNNLIPLIYDVLPKALKLIPNEDLEILLILRAIARKLALEVYSERVNLYAGQILSYQRDQNQSFAFEVDVPELDQTDAVKQLAVAMLFRARHHLPSRIRQSAHCAHQIVRDSVIILSAVYKNVLPAVFRVWPPLLLSLGVHPQEALQTLEVVFRHSGNFGLQKLEDQGLGYLYDRILQGHEVLLSLRVLGLVVDLMRQSNAEKLVGLMVVHQLVNKRIIQTCPQATRSYLQCLASPHPEYWDFLPYFSKLPPSPPEYLDQVNDLLL